jgi:hypothetical protein
MVPIVAATMARSISIPTHTSSAMDSLREMLVKTGAAARPEHG